MTIDEARVGIADSAQALFDVEGVLFPQPFKIRRFGHTGFYLDDLDEGLEFYAHGMGFSVTDASSMLEILPPHARHRADGITDPRLFFTSYGTDHHAVLLVHRSISVMDPPNRSPELTTNQITFQVGSLAEVVNAARFLEEQGVKIIRVGRDMPGSNWHVYFLDPEGNIFELYYGMEQLGWTRNSKPHDMHYRGSGGVPQLPQISEWSEVEEAMDRGVDLLANHPQVETGGTFDVAGILLPRPFKVTKIGPIGLFVEDVDRAVEFYTRLLGFVRSETVEIHGRRCEFLRHGNEHHSMAFYPLELREVLGFDPRTRVANVSFEVASYTQLRAATDYFRQRGNTLVDVPAEFYTGIDYAVHVLDPAGHCIELYCYMEQVGWDGRTRPPSERRKVTSPWPETIEALSDSYVDQIFQGPLG